MKKQKIGAGSLVPVMAPAVDVIWLPGVARRTFREVNRDYWWFRGIVDDGSSQPTYVPADVVDERDDVFTQRTHSE